MPSFVTASLGHGRGYRPRPRPETVIRILFSLAHSRTSSLVAVADSLLLADSLLSSLVDFVHPFPLEPPCVVSCCQPLDFFIDRPISATCPMASVVEMLFETPLIGDSANVEGLVQSVLKAGSDYQDSIPSEFPS